MLVFLVEFVSHFFTFVHQTGSDKGVLRGILHPHHGTAIDRGDLQGHMQLTRRGTTNHNGDIHTFALQLAGHIHHLFETGSDQTTKTDHIDLFLTGFLHNLLCRYHNTHIDHLVAVARHHHTYDILADIMHIALHCSQ